MADIDTLASGAVLDIIGVVESVSDCVPIVTRAGKETHKRTLQIKDNSNASIEVGVQGYDKLAELL